MGQTILITGATGMLGNALTQALLEKGYTVHQLTRRELACTNPDIRTFRWDVYAGYIDERCIENVNAIIHLAGENMAGKPWSKKRQLELVESRTKSIHMIYDLLGKTPGHTVKTVISASGAGFYGDRGDILLTETSIPGRNLVANVTVQWEKAVDNGKLLQLRIVKLRSGIVLDRKLGALPRLSKPVKAFVPAALGSGQQWLPWIHLTDAVNMYIFTLENKDLEGAYNMASPEHVTNEQFMRALAATYHKHWLFLSVPRFILRLILGKMSEMLLMSTKISSDKILKAGFRFKFADLKTALQHVISS